LSACRLRTPYGWDVASAKKELKEIVKAAEGQGWKVKTNKKGHSMFYAPDGINIVTAGGTPSDHRAVANLLSDLRRNGFHGRDGEQGVNDSIYQAWHRKLGRAEYRLRITMAGYGDDEDAAGAFLDAFLSEHPEVGATISQNRAEDTITATFSLSATNEQHALSLGVVIWLESGAVSGLEPHDVVRVEIEAISEDRVEDSSAQSLVNA
jgi:hypothetical protein